MSAPEMTKQIVNKTNIQKNIIRFMIGYFTLKKLLITNIKEGSNIMYPVITVSNLTPIIKDCITVIKETSLKFTLSISVKKRMSLKTKKMLKINP